jgi:TolB-like protein/cytochrome c-type biogenesis protein CcmH/NrfG
MLLTFGRYEIDTELFALRGDGQPRQVEPQVFNLLVYLARHRDRVVTREELLDTLWAGKVVTESTVSSCVKAARQAVGDSGEEQNCIATVHRRGYRFVAKVKEREPPAANDAGVSVGITSQPTTPPHDRPSLAVLPFSHNPGSDTIAWTAQVLSEDIGIRLARIPGFLVMSRESSAFYRGREYSISQVGSELGTDYVVEGSVWETGKLLRVSVQLLETASGRFLWAHRAEIPTDKLAEFQDEVVREIAGRIEPELSRAEFAKLRQRRPVDLGAWALYRQAHANFGLKGWSEESFHDAAALLRQAIARDPELAFAHGHLALVLAIGNALGLVNDPGACAEALVAAETALSLDSQDSEVLGYVGCAFVDMGDVQRGVGLMQRAVELDPSNAQAHAALGVGLLRLGKAEGIEALRHSIRISPHDYRLAAWGALLARGLLSVGKVDEAIEAAKQACRCDDKIFMPRLVLAVALNTAGDRDGARAALDDARRIRPHLTEANLARFASPNEMANLRQSGLL